MIEIDADWAIELLTGLVVDFGSDYVYKKDEREVFSDGSLGAAECYYIEDGKPSCGVGHALIRAGVKPGDFDDLEGLSAGVALGALMDRNVLYSTEGARDVFDRFQAEQDDAAPWGKALSSASQ